MQKEDIENHYLELEADFLEYIRSTASVKYLSLSENGNISQFGYMHRWTASYQKRFIKKLFALQEWQTLKYNLFGKGITFVTLTQKYTDFDFIEDQICDIREKFQLFIKAMRHSIPKIQYLSQLDYHQSGYAHYHIIFFHEFTEDEKLKVAKKWQKINPTANSRSVDFQTSFSGQPCYFVAYIMRHAKSVMYEQENKPGWLRFSSTIYAMNRSSETGVYSYPGVRLFTCSREITKAMQLPEEEKDKTTVVLDNTPNMSTKIVHRDREAWNFEQDNYEDLAEFQKQLELFVGLTI